MDYGRHVAGLSGEELDAEAVRLVGVEKLHVALLIRHLAEIGRRKVYAAMGYGGLFAYCLERLGLSESESALRIQVANVCRRFPCVLEAITGNRMTLTVAAKLAPHLTEENCAATIAACAGLTRRQVEEYVVRFRPRPEVSSGIRRAGGATDVGDVGEEPGLDFSSEQQAGPEADGSAGADCPAASSQDRRSQGAQSQPRSASSKPGVVEPAQVDSFNVRFVASKRLKLKIERLAEVLGVHGPFENLATVLEAAVDLALEKKDPIEKLERRRKRDLKKTAANAETNSSRPDEVSSSSDGLDSAEAKERSRYIPSETRERVLHQAGHRCEFVGPDQHRCGMRTGLQIDHVVPFGKDGSNDEINLRALCPTHNGWYAEQEFGTEFMRSKIAASRKSAGPIDQPTGVREPRPQYRATRHPAKRHRAARGSAINRSTRIPSGRGRAPTKATSRCPALAHENRTRSGTDHAAQRTLLIAQHTLASIRHPRCPSPRPDTFTPDAPVRRSHPRLLANTQSGDQSHSRAS